MADKEGRSVTEEHTGSKRKTKESIFSKKEVKRDFLDITHLIRCIQRVEGNPDCFRRAEGYCEQKECHWRQHCIEG